jgi:pseudouridine-5'-monophosphatase
MAAPILFDLDGVLLDTEPLYTEASQRVVAPFGRTYDWSLKAEVMGRPALVSARVIVERLGLPITPEEYLRRRLEALLPLFERAPEVPGAGDFVRSLAADGRKMAVATSSESSLFSLKTRPHSWFSSFGAVVCGDDPELSNPKPAPDIFLLAAARLGVKSEDCVVFEDSPSGVRAGVAAGMKVIAIRHAAVDVSLFEGAWRVVSSYAELDPREF